MGCLDILLWEVPVQEFCLSFYGLSVVFLLIPGAHLSVEGNASCWPALNVICMSMLASLGFLKSRALCASSLSCLGRVWALRPPCCTEFSAGAGGLFLVFLSYATACLVGQAGLGWNFRQFFERFPKESLGEKKDQAIWGRLSVIASVQLPRSRRELYRSTVMHGKKQQQIDIDAVSLHALRE